MLNIFARNGSPIQKYSDFMDEYWSFINSYAQITNRLIWINNRSTDKKYGE